jgi:hypothetical protein
MRSRDILLATALAAFGVIAGPASGSPPPPPPQDLVTNVEQASCGAQHDAAKPEPIPVAVTRMAPEPIIESTKGTIKWMWGYHMASNDPRIGNVTGLMVDAKYGMIAMTADRNWLILDFETDGDFAAVKAIGLAPMQGAPGRPSAIASIIPWQLVSFPEQRVVQRYAVSTCGVAARGVPAFTIVGQPSATSMVEAAYSYVGLLGEGATGIKDALRLPYEVQKVSLTEQDIPVLPGHRLISLTNGARIVPLILALWAAPGRDAVLQQIYVPAWSDVHGVNDHSTVTEIARFPRTPTGMAAVYDLRSQRTVLFLTFEPTPGAIDVAAIEF